MYSSVTSFEARRFGYHQQVRDSHTGCIGDSHDSTGWLRFFSKDVFPHLSHRYLILGSEITLSIIVFV